MGLAAEYLADRPCYQTAMLGIKNTPMRSAASLHTNVPCQHLWMLTNYVHIMTNAICTISLSRSPEQQLCNTYKQRCLQCNKADAVQMDYRRPNHAILHIKATMQTAPQCSAVLNRSEKVTGPGYHRKTKIHSQVASCSTEHSA